jgi:hypothetical protein
MKSDREANVKMISFYVKKFFDERCQDDSTCFNPKFNNSCIYTAFSTENYDKHSTNDE